MHHCRGQALESISVMADLIYSFKSFTLEKSSCWNGEPFSSDSSDIVHKRRILMFTHVLSCPTSYLFLVGQPLSINRIRVMIAADKDCSILTSFVFMNNKTPVFAIKPICLSYFFNIGVISPVRVMTVLLNIHSTGLQ